MIQLVNSYFLIHTIVPTLLALLLAFLAIRRGRNLIGLILGLGVIAALEVYMNWDLQRGIAECIESACESAGLAAPCEIAEFGCTEWKGMALFFFFVIGIVDTVVFLIGATVMIVLKRRGQARQGVKSYVSEH
jgi:hypothetical protein